MPVQIRTSQNVLLEYEPASLGDRLVATLLDYLIFFGWLILAGYVANAGGRALGNYFWFFFVIAPFLLYDLLCEWLLNGQSLGKLAMSIRVVKFDGSRPGLGDYLIRWLFRLIDTRILNGVVAMVAVAANEQGQRLGDIAAGTTVVKVKAPITLDDVLHRMLPDDHVVQFPDVIALSDRDMNIVRDTLRTRHPLLLVRATERVKSVTGISSPMPADVFLQTVVADHQFMTTRGTA
ncbi:MAG: RDD family protein [Cytophagales bacterium]|nr:MAG: RDD family protein [Cytophagales bacterium]